MNLTNATLKYHYHPAKGWLNDSNGLCWYKGAPQEDVTDDYFDDKIMTLGHKMTNYVSKCHRQFDGFV